MEQLKKAFEGGGMGNLGQLLALEARQRTNSGRVGVLAVIAEKGEQVFRGVDLRRILGYRELRSTRFDIKVERTIPIYYQNVIQGADKVETKVSVIPSTIEIGFEETQPRWAGTAHSTTRLPSWTVLAASPSTPPKTPTPWPSATATSSRSR